MARLIALIGLRLKLTLRAYLRARESLVGLLIALPIMALFSLALAFGIYWVVSGLARKNPHEAAAILSAAATVLGLGWSLSPLFSGAALAEGHDLTRLAHFPVSSRWIFGSSLLAHFIEPSLWSFIPASMALALALSHGALLIVPSLIGIFLTLLFTVIVAQGAALLLEWIARRRKWHDRVLVLGFFGGILFSLAPLWLLIGGSRALSTVLRLIVGTDVFLFSPFAWGLRAAVYGGRGELLPFLGFSALALAACVAGFAASIALTAMMISTRGSLGGAVSGRGPAHPPRFLPGEAGAILSKDLRMIWRDPGLKAALLMGLVAPIVVLIWMGQSSGSTPSLSAPFFLSLLVGLAPIGMHTFGLERRGIQLLMSFPASRFKILAGKNAATLVMRLPGLVLVLFAAAVMAPAFAILPSLATSIVLLLISAAAENYLSILFPVTLPAPGRSPHARPAGGRGMGLFIVTTLTVGLVLVISAPFVLLAWLPVLLEITWAVWLALPLAVAGAAAAYALLAFGAERLLLRRETQLLERILSDAIV